MTVKGWLAPKRVALAAGLVLAVCIGAWIYVQSAEAGMLRRAPDTVTADPGLTRLAEFFGGQVFSARCVSCHGADAKGDRRTGAPDLADSEWLYGEGKISDIEQVVNYGIRAHHSKTKNLAAMPAFGRAFPYANYKVAPLTPAQIGDVVEYLTFMQGKPADQGPVGRGAVIYNGSGACYDCHASDGKGDNFIGAPNLTDNVTLFGDGSKKSLTESISLGRGGICPGWIFDLGPAAIREVSLYVYSLSHRQAPAQQARHAN
ncbi:MAG: c-type cytochrome [Pseudomonadota bacterium]